MAMLLHIIRKELLDQLMSLRFAIACVVCLLVFLLSSIVLTRDYREATSTYNMNRVMHRNALQQQTEVWSLFQGVMVDRPLNVMNILVRGLTPELTESIKVQAGNRLDFPESFEQNPVIALFPAVDFVFIVGIIMSLLALAFSYDSMSGERESGVLKLLMSYSVARDRVLLGKWIGGYLALTAPFVTSFAAGLLVVVMFPEVSATADNALAIFALLCLALLYLAVIYSLGMFVSARTRVPSTSITVLLLIWVAFILAIPNMAPYMSAQLLPVPSRESVDREKAGIRQEMAAKQQRIIREEQERTGREDVWQDEDFQARMRALGEEMQQIEQKVEEGYLTKIQDQTRWSGIVARISPLTSFNLAAFDLAAAGIAQEARFVDALKAYSQTWQTYSEEKQKAWREYMERQRSADGSVSFNSEEMEQFRRVDLTDYPRFEFSHMPLLDRLSEIYLDILLLAVWNILFFMLAYLSFLRYDIQ
jgi:ABC-type transport system involved in multi-copper enzyme maturation permease subunit